MVMEKKLANDLYVQGLYIHIGAVPVCQTPIAFFSSAQIYIYIYISDRKKDENN